MKIKPYTLLWSVEKDLKLSRTYQEFTTEDEMAAFLIALYEENLHMMSMETTGDLTYESKDLFLYLNNHVGELVCLRLVDNNSDDLWEPLPKDWIHERIYTYLRSIVDPKVNDEAMEVCSPD